MYLGIQGCTECRPYGAMAWFSRGLADQSIMQLSDTFSKKHQTAQHTYLCIYISALFSISPEKMVLSNEGSGVRSQLEQK